MDEIEHGVTNTPDGKDVTIISTDSGINMSTSWSPSVDLEQPAQPANIGLEGIAEVNIGLEGIAEVNIGLAGMAEVNISLEGIAEVHIGLEGIAEVDIGLEVIAEVINI